VGVALSSPAGAIPLSDLYAGATLSAGIADFTDWTSISGSADPSLIEVEPVDFGEFIGFTVTDTSSNFANMSGGNPLTYGFTINPSGLEVIGAGLILTQFEVEGESSINVLMAGTGVDRDVFVDLLNNLIELADWGTIGSPLSTPSDLQTAITQLEIPIGRVGSYTTLFTVVPEPSTAALTALGLIGLAARRRRP